MKRRVLLAGSVTIAFVGLLGYGLAPAIARSRVSQQQRAQAARVLAQVGDGVFLVDRDGVVRLWNAAAESITGLPEEAVLGRRIDEAVPGWSAVAGRIPVARNGFSGRRPAEVVPLELEGRDLWLSIAGVESTEGSVYTFRDLTDEHRLEKAKADFVSTVSHELRTPLASIHGAALTLRRRREGLDGPMGEQLLDVIAEQSDRLSHLVGQILLAGRLDSDELEVARETFDPESVARAVVETTRLSAPRPAYARAPRPGHAPTGRGRSGSGTAGARKSDRERDQVHALGRANRRRAGANRRRRPLLGLGRRARHSVPQRPSGSSRSSTDSTRK